MTHLRDLRKRLGVRIEFDQELAIIFFFLEVCRMVDPVGDMLNMSLLAE